MGRNQKKFGEQQGVNHNKEINVTRRLFFALTSAGLLALNTMGPHRANAQDASTVGVAQVGWLEGTVVDEQGLPVVGVNSLSPPHIKGIRRGGGTFDVTSDSSMGGLYSVRNLQPGIYDLTIPMVRIVTNQGDASYSPQRIFGVIIKPGIRTILSITLEEGDTLKDIGQPAVTEQGLLVSQELAKLQKQIDDLKEQLKELTANEPKVVGGGTP